MTTTSTSDLLDSLDFDHAPKCEHKDHAVRNHHDDGPVRWYEHPAVADCGHVWGGRYVCRSWRAYVLNIASFLICKECGKRTSLGGVHYSLIRA